MTKIRDASDLLEELQASDESPAIEAKTASRMGPSILETICALANEPGLGGGHLLLGVARSKQGDLFGTSYDVVGVPEPDRLQSDLASQCASAFNRPIRPLIKVEQLQGKSVLVVFIDEASPNEKPIYLKNLGLPRGAFRRIGSSDQHGTDDDILALYHDHDADTYDASIVRDSDLSDVDDDAVRAYRELRSTANPDAEELAWSDNDLLRALGALDSDRESPRLTVAGMLLFGSTKALRRCFPMMRIDYVRIPGREWVKDPDRRFDTVEIRAPLILAARRAINAVRDDLPASFSLPEGEAMRTSETILPVRVLREAIVNAVMHRSYRLHGPIQVLRYSNRLEIRNPGHSLKSPDRLGEPGSQTRNPRIAAVLHDVHMAETKGSGIRAMRELMQDHNLLQPTFESTRQPDQFVATFLFHHFLGAGDLAWLGNLTEESLSDEEARALVFVRETGAIDNAAYRAINRSDTLTASAHLRRLRDLELLDMKGSGNRTYYVPGSAFALPPETPGQTTVGGDITTGDPHHPPADPHHPPTDPHHLPADPHHLDSDDRPTDNSPSGIPVQVAQRIARAGPRPRQQALRSLILELCTWNPMSARQLAEHLGGRNPKELIRNHLAPMLQAGSLIYTIPQMPNHPDQRYAVPTDRTDAAE
ncbi:MAG: putative DNA binding domain-containing protein [Planctomycetes bacterium]|nr:putative DNA binding domain-containing protein [Planctomycetota bacterium]